MRLVSPLLQHVVYPGLSRTGILRRGAAPGSVAIVTFHGIIPPGYEVRDQCLDGALVTADSFRRQLRLLKARYNVISPEEFLHWGDSGPLPPRSILLTCDDGLQNAVSEMLPILLDENLSCLFFLTGTSLGDSPAMLWHEELYLMLLAGPQVAEIAIPQLALNLRANGDSQKRLLWFNLLRRFSQCDGSLRARLLREVKRCLCLREGWMSAYWEHPGSRSRFLTMTRAGIQQLIAGGMSIGAHTESHPMLSQLSAHEAWHEIANNRHRLEQVTGQPVRAFAYPFGNFGSVTPREVEMVQRAGYSCAFANVGGGFGARLPRYALPRIHVTAKMSQSEFEAHLSGIHRSLRESFGRRDSLFPGPASKTEQFLGNDYPN